MPAARPEPFDLDLIFNRIASERHVALAVSGGSDSMALLRLAALWSKARPDRPKLTILTVDHGLRPEAAGEARKVAVWAEALGHSHAVLKWLGPKPMTGLQAKARDARYDLMGAWARDHGASWILTAHTLDDQAETVLMRMQRTSSLDSLAGVRQVSQWSGVGLFRPLLGERRDRLRAFLTEVGQAWIEDPSNDDERFERVRLRKAMPALLAGGLSLAALGELARQSAAASDALWAAAGDWVSGHVAAEAEGFGRLPLAGFAGQPDLIKSRILGHLIRRFGGGQVPDPHELEAMTGWMTSGSRRRTLGGALFARRKDHVLVGREPGRIDASPVAVPATGQALWDRRFVVTAPPDCLIVPVGTVRGIPRRADLPAFVQAALPAVMQGGKLLAVPHLGIGEGINATIAASFRN